MANIIIGTAGHIDHGKSTLIKTLTGISTDTTEEEIERGLSINLGFAYFDLPDGRRVGIIDVPGHERFIKNMLAGAQGINMILLVIDANEGVMPQTVEHAQILTLLGIENFIVLLSKADTSEEELMDLMEEDIRERFKNTPIENAPVVRVDSVTGRGIPELINNIESVSKKVPQKNLTSDPRLNIDRVFSVKGFGTVVTGTLTEGVINTGEEMMLYTSMLPTRVRSIQVHEKNVESASAGQRTALNLQNLKVTDIRRGDVLSKEGAFRPSYIVDASIRVLPDFDRPLKLWDRVRVYHGTREVMARAVPLGAEIISPGEEGFVQLRLEEEIISKPGDRIILRQYSPMVTLGGGAVLDPTTVKHRRFDEEILERLKARENQEGGSQVLEFISVSDKPLVTLNEILQGVRGEKAEVTEEIEKLLGEGEVYKFSDVYVSRDRFMEIRDEFTRIVSQYHKTNPLKPGMPKEELKSKMKYLVPAKYFDAVLEKTVSLGFLKAEMSNIRQPEFEVEYTKEQKKIREDILDKLKEDGFSPRSLKELTKDKGYRPVMESMMDSEVIRLDPDMVMLRENFKTAYEAVLEMAGKNGSVTLAEVRDRLGTSRKYAVAVLDFLDKAGITVRQEDIRKLTGKKLSI